MSLVLFLCFFLFVCLLPVNFPHARNLAHVFTSQCKSSRAKVPVQLIREFEGVLGRENSGVVGFFFSPSGSVLCV